MVMKDFDSESTENPRFGCRSWILGHDTYRFGWRMDVHWPRDVNIQNGRLNMEPWRPHAMYESRFKNKRPPCEGERGGTECRRQLCVFSIREIKGSLTVTLQQHGFELCGSTYTRIFSSSKYYNPTQSVVGRISGCGRTTISEPSSESYTGWALHCSGVNCVLERIGSIDYLLRDSFSSVELDLKEISDLEMCLLCSKLVFKSLAFHLIDFVNFIL